MKKQMILSRRLFTCLNMLLCQFILAPVIIATPLIDEHQRILEEAKKETLIPSQQPAFTGAGMHINHIQFVGSHNSYKQAMPDGFVKQLMKVNPKVAEGLEYEHAPLAEQLDLGIRKIELDVFYVAYEDQFLVGHEIGRAHV